MLEIKNISKFYHKKAVLDNVSAQLIYEEEIINNLNPQENEFSTK